MESSRCSCRERTDQYWRTGVSPAPSPRSCPACALRVQSGCIGLLVLCFLQWALRWRGGLPAAAQQLLQRPYGPPAPVLQQGKWEPSSSDLTPQTSPGSLSLSPSQNCLKQEQCAGSRFESQTWCLLVFVSLIGK